MAEVTVTSSVNLRVTDAEWRLIMKSLAAFAGLKISSKHDERTRAAELNKQLLFQRRTDLRDQLEVAEAAVARAEADSEDPDGSADVAVTAFHVGKELGRKEHE